MLSYRPRFLAYSRRCSLPPARPADPARSLIAFGYSFWINAAH